MQKIPYMLVIGDREAESGLVSVRSHKEGDLGAMPEAEFLEKVKGSGPTRPDEQESPPPKQSFGGGGYMSRQTLSYNPGPQPLSCIWAGSGGGVRVDFHREKIDKVTLGFRGFPPDASFPLSLRKERGCRAA